MSYFDKGVYGFKRLLISLERVSRDNTEQNRKWVRLWGRIGNYEYYKIKNPK